MTAHGTSNHSCKQIDAARRRSFNISLLYLLQFVPLIFSKICRAVRESSIGALVEFAGKKRPHDSETEIRIIGFLYVSESGTFILMFKEIFIKGIHDMFSIRSCTDDEMRRIDEALMLSLGVEVSGGNTTEEAKETINALKLELVETKKIGEELKHKLKEEADKREAMETAMNPYEKNTEDASDIVDGRIKAAAERDVYKELYMYLLDRAISA